MKTGKWMGTFALLLAVMMLSLLSPARAQESAKGKPTGPVGAFWALPKEEGKVSLIVAGKPDPIATTVASTTIFAGICLDCNLYFEFKPAEVPKNCNVCGCAVSNAACMVGKPVKEGTWQAMLKQLPRGVALRPTYNEADKPESGLKKLHVDLRTVLLPVSGLESQTPEQLLALVKPLGGTEAQMIDGGKRLQIKLKSDWNFERASKLEKALAKLNAKIVVPEEPKATQ